MTNTVWVLQNTPQRQGGQRAVSGLERAWQARGLSAHSLARERRVTQERLAFTLSYVKTEKPVGSAGS